jgi:hypothetical protein
MRTILTLFSALLLITLLSCNGLEDKAKKVETNFDFSGKIIELIQTSNYSYCLMEEGGSEYWIAISKEDLKEGQTLYYNYGLEMKDFKSKELNRSFPTIYFVQESSSDPMGVKVALGHTQTKPSETIKNITVVETAKGGISIAELFANKEKYSGKKVRIRGKVVKFNPEIMGKNWMHIQDGTDFNGNFDLTVTTQQKVNVGAIVTMEGIISIDEDFGAGYSYDVIMEEAEIFSKDLY